MIARFFDASGEVLAMKTEAGDRRRALTSTKPLEPRTGYQDQRRAEAVRAGVKDGKGNVNPVFGNNAVFAKQGSR